MSQALILSFVNWEKQPPFRVVKINKDNIYKAFSIVSIIVSAQINGGSYYYYLKSCQINLMVFPSQQFQQFKLPFNPYYFPEN